MNELFTFGGEEKNEIFLPINILNVQIEKQNDTRKVNSKLSAYISYQGSGYPKQALDKVKTTCYDSKIYVPQIMSRHMLDWYNFYLNHSVGSRLSKTTR